jgi:hypothetical protein
LVYLDVKSPAFSKIREERALADSLVDLLLVTAVFMRFHRDDTSIGSILWDFMDIELEFTVDSKLTESELIVYSEMNVHALG